ncbi:MAG: protein phosphatase 2C domain-containing protein [Butyrivibrio sp.]|nr:protein phosphatase 2C domain-containing protein [Muribaculum sp.]MCM1552939.1 protein phosphatase 2C domain-containing protein [Butyrivibrio sp.]
MSFFLSNIMKAAKRESVSSGVIRRLSYQVANLQGVGTREHQEDSFAFSNALDVTGIRKKGLLAVVADGMGGMRDGKLASETAANCLKKIFDGMDRSGDLAQQLCDGVFSAGEQVRKALDGEGGSTVVACIVYQEQMYYASVGDSFLYLKRGQQLIRLNCVHNCKNQAYLETIRSGSMNPDRGRNHREKAALTQFLGMDGLDEVDYLRRPLPLQDGDIILICSDGVGGVLTEQELALCLEEKNPSKMCAEIENAIVEKKLNSKDNYTALVIQCGY